MLYSRIRGISIGSKQNWDDNLSRSKKNSLTQLIRRCTFRFGNSLFLADSGNIPWNPSRIATVTRKFRPQISVPLFSNPIKAVGAGFSITPWLTSQTHAKFQGNESTSAARTSATSSCEIVCFTDPE